MGYTLSVPSWVIPGTYAENLRFLENKKEVTGVELLFFIYNDEIRKQLDSEWDEIRTFEKRFVFTAHLPDVLLPSHDELVARLAPLVSHFIVHPPKENQAALVPILAEWVKKYNVKFLVENTNPGLLEAMLPHLNLVSHNTGSPARQQQFPETGIGLCMDTGHLLIEGKNPADFFRKYREHIGEIHLHTVNREQAAIDGRLADHRQLRKNEPWLIELLSLLGDFRGTINLELFSWQEVSDSMEIISFYLPH